MTRFRLLPAALATALVTGIGAAQAEVQKFIVPCPGQKLCASYQLVLTPPDGWVIDKDATAKNHVQMIVPKGKTFGDAPALIYVQVFYHADKTQTLEDFARVSNERWLAENASAKISPLSAIARTNGKQGFLRFAFQNPSRTAQAYEAGAFGIDNDKDGNEFVLDVVITGAEKKSALDRADTDYVAFLKAN